MEGEAGTFVGLISNSGTITSIYKGIEVNLRQGEAQSSTEAESSAEAPKQNNLAGIENSGDITSGWRNIDVLVHDASVGNIENTGNLHSTQNNNLGPGPGPFPIPFYDDWSGSENIYVTGYRSKFGDIINSGTVTAEGDDAIEVQIYDGSTMGDIINENTGSLTAWFDGLDVDVHGNSTVEKVINRGHITAANDGIEVDAEDGSRVDLVENSGSINGIMNENNIADGISIDVINESSIGSVVNTGSVSTINNDIVDFDIESGSKIDSIINSGSLSFNTDGINFSSTFSGIEIEMRSKSDEGATNHIEVVDNSGSIEASGHGITLKMEDESTVSKIINSGSLTSSHAGIWIDTLDNDIATDMLIDNSGSITSKYYDGIQYQGYLNGTLNNSGSVTGKQHGISIFNDWSNFYSGDTSDFSLALNNSGTITGQAGNGIYITKEMTGTINNTGTIASQSSGDMFADYGVNTNLNDYQQLSHESMQAGTQVYHLGDSNWYVLEKTEGDQTLRRFFQSHAPEQEVLEFIATGQYDHDSDSTFRPGDEYTIAFDQIVDDVSGRLTEYVSPPINLSSVRDNGGSSISSPRYVNASAIKLTGTFNGNIENSGELSSVSGATIDVKGSLNGTLYNSGTISGGVLISQPVNSVQWGEGEDIDGPFTINGDFSRMLDNGYYPGLAVHNAATGPQAGDRIAIDFSQAQTALTLEQTGADANILGDVWGQIAGSDDEATFSGGSLTGNLQGVENVMVTGGNFTLNGNSLEQGGFTNQFTVNSSGILALGTHTGTQIEGNYTQAGGLITSVGTVNSAFTGSNQAALTVGDTATISGSMTVNPVWSEFSYSRTTQEKYRVVNAQETNYTGSLTNQTVLFDQSISEESGTDLYLNMRSNDLETEVENASENNLYGDLAGKIQDALVTQGAQSNLFQALLNVADGEELSDIIENSVTNNDGSEALLAEALQDGVFNNILGRLAETRSGQGGVSFGDEEKWHGGVWLKALMVRADQAKQRSGTTTFNGYKSNTKGFTLGYDVDINERWTAGIAGSYADSKMEVKNSSDETSVKSYQLSFYGNWQRDDWFVDSIINVGINKNNSSRISGGNIAYKADFDSTQYGLRVVGGKEFWFNDKDTLLEAQLIFNYSHLSTDNYKEKASGQSDIKVKSSDYEVLELGTGLRFTHLFELDSSALLPEASAKVYYDLKGDTMSQDVNVNILNTDLNYRTTGLEAQRLTYQVGTGLSWWLDNSVTLSLNYDRTWRSGFSADSIQAKFRYDF